MQECKINRRGEERGIIEREERESRKTEKEGGRGGGGREGKGGGGGGGGNDAEGGLRSSRCPLISLMRGLMGPLFHSIR